MSPDKPSRIIPFNPLDKTNLGESVAEALLVQEISLLPPPNQFIGAGVYAIYYEGDFPLYKDISKCNKNELYKWPIYVGKAIPAGGRKGGFGLDSNPGLVLFKRLSEHAASIDQSNNLNLNDFRCRFLVVDDIWIPLAESMLIIMFFPLWNVRIDGFGNHDPGSGRYNQQKSVWDVIHPGRPWATKLQPQSMDERAIKEIVAKYLAKVKDRIVKA